MTTTTLPLVPQPRTGDEGGPAEPVSTDGCEPYSEDVCFDCTEPTSWVVISPCSTGCCDRPLCLDCASRQGIEID
jgi:hypothetical protein